MLWQKINHIADRIILAADAYYNEQPVMSDAEYDQLCDELRKLCPKHPVLKRVGAPVSTSSKLAKVRHHMPMGSLAKASTREEFDAWVKKTGETKFVVQEKLDGISVEIEYQRGRYTRAATRGDGIIGEDVTHTVRFMSNVPMKLPRKFTGYLRGEIILSNKKFAQHFADSGYANPRNTVSGLVRRKQEYSRIVHFQVRYFDVVSSDIEFNCEYSRIPYIQGELNLYTVPSYVLSQDQVYSIYDDYCATIRAARDYDLDGLVIKVNDLALAQELGVQDGRPRGQIAWKFPSQAAQTILRRVEWQVGVTGRVTPVAVLDPVQLAGVTIERASLHNVGFISRLGLTALPARVLVRRFGDVIPGVDRVLKVGKRPLQPPETCPACAATLERVGEYLVCLSARCPEKVRGDLGRWIEVLDIQGLGDSFVRDVTAPGFEPIVRSPAQLYQLELADLLSLPGYQLTRAKKALAAIQRSRQVPLVQFLTGLNIPEAGRATWEAILAAGHTTLEQVLALAASPEKLIGIPGIAEKTAQIVAAGLRAKTSCARALVQAGVTPAEPRVGPLTGLSFCFTGSLPSGMSRPTAQKLVVYRGGTVKSSVGKGLSYLVQANKKSTSTKTQKANKYGVKIIDEDDFLNIIGFDVTMLDAIK